MCNAHTKCPSTLSGVFEILAHRFVSLLLFVQIGTVAQNWE